MNPKKEDAAQGVVLPALAASDVDLRNGVIKPFDSNSFEEQGHSKEIIKVGEDWYSGHENYVHSKIRGFDVIVFKDGEKWKRITRKPRLDTGAVVPDKIVDLGLVIPEEPKITPLPVSDLVQSPQSPTETNPYEANYCITWLRNIDGYP